MSTETQKVETGTFSERLAKCTKRVQLVAHMSSSSSADLAALLDADEAYRSASSELRKFEDEERLDDIYLAALSTHTAASAVRSDVLARLEVRHG